MKLVIVSGRSGSGKTITLHVLEDMGYYCVDNAPVALLPAFATEMGRAHPLVAVSIDARNAPAELTAFQKVATALRSDGIDLEIMYLDANDNTLLARFSETRRKHPLTGPTVSLREAIQKELDLLNPIANLADFTLDTSALSRHELCQIIRDRSAIKKEASLSLMVQSFGYRHGLPPDADCVFDVRCLPNPYWRLDLRRLSGLDAEVAKFLRAQPQVQEMIEYIMYFLNRWIPRFEHDNRSYMSIAIGCTGGQHRSVFIVEELARVLKQTHPPLLVRHRELSPQHEKK